MAREGLEDLSGVCLSGENVGAHWAHTPAGPLSEGGGAAGADVRKRRGRGRLRHYLPSVCVQGHSGQMLCYKEIPEISL